MGFDSTKYNIYTWKNGIILYRIINPLLAFNELFLGQRSPGLLLVDKTSSKPKVERVIIPCPHCKTMHDGRTWYMQNNTIYKNWFGLYCPDCGGIIPCVTNILSALILVLTFPLWIWFYKNLKNRWLQQQPSRYTQITLDKQGHLLTGNGWIIQGMIWGFQTYLITMAVIDIFDHMDISLKSILFGIPIWLIVGLGWGYLMKQFYDHDPKLN